MKIQDQIKDKNFSFGLWAHCPEHVPVAWGARAIADNGCGFALLPDRQTWAGPKALRGVFSRVLNRGPLKRAILEAKRLRDGWVPFSDLSDKAFEEYWYKRLREEPELFESFSASSGDYMPESPGYPHFDAPKDARPLAIKHACEREQEAIEAAEKEFFRMEESGEEFPVPDPPSACENDYEGYCEGEDEEAPDPCEQKFKKVRGEWQGCYQEDDAWVCEECGHHHYFDDDVFEGEPWVAPKARIQKAYRKIVGHQRQRMYKDKAELFTLYDDHFITIKANTNASHGYIYLIAYPKHSLVEEIKHAKDHPGFENGNGATLAAEDDVFWSGPSPVPQPGDKVTITRPELGQATVLSHFVEHNYLHLITVPDGPLPDWRVDQIKNQLFPTSETWNVVGSEIGEEVIPAPEENGEAA